jgi:hypothetical protein
MNARTAKAELDDGHGGAESAQRWYRRPGILIAAAALTAEVGIVVSGAGGPGTAPDGTTRTSTPWSASFSLIATGWIPTPEPPPAPPPPPPPPVAAPPPPDPPAAEPAVQAPRRVATPVWEPPEVVVPAPPPPPPPPQLVFRFDTPGTATVSITNHDKPAVGCMLTSVAVAGTATMINYRRDYPFTVTGSEVTRIDPDGPATGSTFHVTVTCDNGLSSSLDTVY